jgi:DNA-binding NarL/FixJ family response regulator
MVTAQPIRVMLVDDHAMVRQGLRSVLDEYPNIEVVGEAADGEDAIRLVTKLQPSVVIMDINLPKLDGISATRYIKTNYPEVAVIGLSLILHSHSEHAMLEAGAFEVLDKEKTAHELYGAIQRAVAAIQPVLILKDIAVETPSVGADLPGEKSDTAPVKEKETEGPNKH